MAESDSFNELVSLAAQLNAQSENLNHSISAFNRKLASLNLGLEVWLSDQIPLQDSGQYYIRDQNARHGWKKGRDLTILGFCEVENEWQLAVRTETLIYEADIYEGDIHEPIPDHVVTCPLLKANRSLRTSAIVELDNLVCSLKEKAKEVLQSMASVKQLSAVA
jgi:hypothetical protein